MDFTRGIGMHEPETGRRLRVRKKIVVPAAEPREPFDPVAGVLAMLDEEDGFMCHDGSWPSPILKSLVEQGLVECEIRVGIPTYWKIAALSGSGD